MALAEHLHWCVLHVYIRLKHICVVQVSALTKIGIGRSAFIFYFILIFYVHVYWVLSHLSSHFSPYLTIFFSVCAIKCLGSGQTLGLGR